jgi:hypothetical protein
MPHITEILDLTDVHTIGGVEVESYLSLPGSAGNTASIPDTGALDISTAIDIRWHGFLADWTPPSDAVLASKYVTAGDQRGYIFRVISATGVLSLDLSSTGANNVNVVSSVAPSVLDGNNLWVRVTWRASDGRVQFFTSNDGVFWTQLGSDQTIALAGIFNNTAPFEMGVLEGGVYTVKLYAAINGTAQRVSADFFQGPIGATTISEKTSALFITVNQSGDPKAEIVEVV